MHDHTDEEKSESHDLFIQNRDGRSAIFREALESIVIIDTFGKVVDCNPASESLFGWKRAEVLGKNMSQLIIPVELRGSHQAGLETYRKEGVGNILSKRLEVPAVKVDGTKIFIELTVVEIKESSETQFVGFIRDITSKKEAEKALQLTQFSVDRAGYSVFWILKDSSISYANDEACQSTGLSRQEIYSNSILDLLSNYPIDNWDDHWLEMTIRGVKTTEAYCTRQDGTKFPVQITENFIEFHDTEYICAIALDISEQKKSEFALRESEEKLAAIMDAAFDAVFMTDSHSQITLWNPAAEKLFQYDSTEIEGKPVQMVVQPARNSDFNSRFSNTFYQEKPGVDFKPTTYEMLGIRKGGNSFPIEVSISSIELQNQWWFVGVIRDITDRKKIEQQLRTALDDAQSANLTKSEFLAVISHEMRTPLNGILGIIQLLEQTELRGQQAEYISSCRAAADQLRTLISDVLDFSQIESGYFELRESTFCLPDVLNDLIETYKSEASKSSVEFRFQIDPLLPEQVYGDRGRLRQVLENLLCNAVKFTDVGYIQLSARLLEKTYEYDRILFRVQDTGIGISVDDRKRIFNPFEQADTSSTRRYGGIGLGLSICKQIVQMLGGELTVSDGPLDGSEFSFTVNFGRDESSQIVGAKNTVNYVRSAIKSTNRQIRLLVVDDDDLSRKVLTGMLQNLGFYIESAVDGLEAVKLFQESGDNSYDLILMDMMMPNMGGEEATAEIRKIESEYNRHVPIIALTARAMKGDKESCLAADMDAFVSKPYELQELLDIIIPFLWSDNTADGRNRKNDDIRITEYSFDKQKLLEKCQFDKSFLREVVDLFNSTSVDLSIKISQSLALRNQEELRRHVHKLKGAASNFCSASIIKEIEALEHSLSHSTIDWLSLEKQYDKLSNLLSFVRTELKNFIFSHDP